MAPLTLKHKNEKRTIAIIALIITIINFSIVLFLIWFAMHFSGP
ncbi:hypothetical protein [Gracilibacillus ureilyticus]|nr:hypothetical protein [Gracilibacillus ureilyticus]